MPRLHQFDITASAKKQRLQEAQVMHSAGQLKEAEAIYSEVVREAPDDHEAYFLLAIAQMEAAKNEEAMVTFDHLFKLSRATGLAYFAAGKCSNRLGQYDKAIRYLRATLETTPDFAEAHLELGKAYMKSGALKEAGDSFGAAINCRSEYAEAFFEFGLLLTWIGNIDAAIGAYMRALEFDPTNIEALRPLYRLLEASNRYEAARKQVDTAIGNHPELAGLRTVKGMLHNRLEEPEIAAESFAKSIELNPDLPEAYEGIATSFGDLGRYKESTAMYEKAAELAPDSAHILNNLGTNRAQNGRHEEALECFRRSLESGERAPQTFYQIALAAPHTITEEELAEMHALREDEATLDAEKAVLGFAIGNILDSNKQYREAFANFMQGAEARRKVLAYSEEAEQRSFKTIKQIFKQPLRLKKNGRDRGHNPYFYCRHAALWHKPCGADPGKSSTGACSG